MSTGSSIYSTVVGVISKPVLERTDFEIQPLLPWFRKKSDLFRHLKQDILTDIIKNCQFTTKHKNDVIIKQGEQGDCCYIALGGKVSIYIVYTKKEGTEEGNDGGQTDPPVVVVTEDNIEDRSKLGIFVCSLVAGSTFGEVALVSEDCIRTASIVSDTKTDLIVIDRTLYNRSVKEVLAKEFAEKSNFITINPFLGAWPPKYKKQLTMAFQKETKAYDSVLVRQGEPVKEIYFILRNFSKTHRIGVSKSPAPRAQRPAGFQNVDVCYLGVNEVIGDTEVFLELGSYIQTAICTQKTEVLALGMKHYERLFTKRNPRTIELMKQSLHARLEARFCQPILQQFPLVDHAVKKALEFNEPAVKKDDRKEQLSKKNEIWDCRQLPRGCLVDQHAPGTVFHYIRTRERARLARLKTWRKMPAGLQKRVTGLLPSLNNTTPDKMVEESDGRESDKGNGAQEVTSATPPPLTSSPKPSLAIQALQKRAVKANEIKLDDDDDLLSMTDDQYSALLMANQLERLSKTYTRQETSLDDLEDKIKNWLGPTGSKRGEGKVAKLRRIDEKELERQAIPGAKVHMKRSLKLVKRHSVDHIKTSPNGGRK